MIRFSASLVVVGVGLLVAGSVTSKLLLIYIAIGVSAVALLFLIIGAIVNRAELLGREPDGMADGQAEQGEYAGELDQTQETAATAVGAGAAAGRGYTRERAEGSGYGAAAPPDRPRQAPFPGQPVYRDDSSTDPGRGARTDGGGRRGGQPAHPDFAGYERFAGAAGRGRPSEPQQRPEQPFAEPKRPFADPEPTRMDLTAADVREAGRQERERSERDRQERERSERDRAERNRPEWRRPERQPADQPFADPEPTRMDLTAADVREAGQQQRVRQDQERRDRQDRDRPERRRGESEPTRMDWGPGLREREQGGGTSAPGRSSGERETAHPAQPASSPSAPARPAPARPDKLLVGRPDDAKTPLERREGPDRPDGPDRSERRERPREPEKVAAPTVPAPAMTQGGSGRPGPDRAGDNDGGNADRPAEASAAWQLDAPAPAADPAAANANANAKPEDGQDGAGAGAADSAASDQDDVTVVPGVPRYHRSECILIRFMGDNDLQQMPVERAREAGCTPCRACQPDGDEDE